MDEKNELYNPIILQVIASWSLDLTCQSLNTKW